MKYIKYLVIAMLAMTITACGDDEPSNTYTREFNMIYPQLPAGHKSLSKIERTNERGDRTVATDSYDGDRLVSVKVVVTGQNNYTNEETITFDYKNGAIICDKSIQDVTYAFEVNSYGAITKLTNVTTNRTSSAMVYEGNRLEAAQEVTPSSTGTTAVKWENGNITQWFTHDVNKLDSVVYEYSAGTPLNKGCIDIPGNESFTFTIFVCAFMRNAGLFGATSTYLPSVIKKGYDYSQEVDPTNPNAPLELKRYPISYTLDAEGYVTSYTIDETPKYTVKFTYR